MTYEPYWRFKVLLAAGGQRLTKNKSQPEGGSCLDQTWMFAPALRVFLSQVLFLEFGGWQGGTACPAPAWNHVSHGEGQGGTHSVEHSNGLCSVPVALSAKESSKTDRMSLPFIFFFQSFKGKLCEDDNYLFSSRASVSFKPLGIILMNKPFEHACLT